MGVFDGEGNSFVWGKRGEIHLTHPNGEITNQGAGEILKQITEIKIKAILEGKIIQDIDMDLGKSLAESYIRSVDAILDGDSNVIEKEFHERISLILQIKKCISSPETLKELEDVLSETDIILDSLEKEKTTD